MRFDRDQYTWKSDSSQLLRTGLLRWGSNLFHIGILFLFFGHLFGLLTPHWFYGHFLQADIKQKLAIYSGGFFGVLCFIGLSMLIYRRVFDPRIRRTSHRTTSRSWSSCGSSYRSASSRCRIRGRTRTAA